MGCDTLGLSSRELAELAELDCPPRLATAVGGADVGWSLMDWAGVSVALVSLAWLLFLCWGILSVF